MFEIKYEIGLNDNGRPCIELPINYEHRPEDKFLSIELTRYIILDLLQRRGKDVDEQTIETMNIVTNFLGQIGDEMAEILHGQMKAMGDIDMMLNKFYHINVKSIEERNALPDKDILYKGKIFNRVEGLCVQVNDSLIGDGHYAYTPNDFMPIVEMYKLEGGISNEHWVKLTTEEINKKWKKND